VPGVPVVVNDAAGTVVLVTQSGAGGTVPVTVPPGGSVSIFASYGLNFDVQAIVAPPDGATVRFTVPTIESKPPPDKTTFHVALTQVPSSAVSIDVYSCERQATAYVSNLNVTMDNAGCTNHSASSFIAIASDINVNPIAWGTALDQPNNPGGIANVQIALDHADFDVIADMITDIPPETTDARVEVVGDLNATSPAQLQVSVDQVSGSTLSASLLLSSGIFKDYEVGESIDINGTNAGSSIARWRTYRTAPKSTDFSSLSMALVAVDPLDITDPVHPLATWSVGAGTRGDYGTVYIHWVGGTASYGYSATFPPDHVTSFRIPDIPPELSSFAPTKTSTFPQTGVDYTHDERINGYEQSNIFHSIAPVDGLGTIISGGTNMK
jgi:hypothetical protein